MLGFVFFAAFLFAPFVIQVGKITVYVTAVSAGDKGCIRGAKAGAARFIFSIEFFEKGFEEFFWHRIAAIVDGDDHFFEAF